MSQPRVGHMTVDHPRAREVERVELDGELVEDVYELHDEEGWVLVLNPDDGGWLYQPVPVEDPEPGEPTHRVRPALEMLTGHVDVFFKRG